MSFVRVHKEDVAEAWSGRVGDQVVKEYQWYRRGSQQADRAISSKVRKKQREEKEKNRALLEPRRIKKVLGVLYLI